MLFKDFIDKKDFIVYIDTLYRSDEYIKDIINRYIGNDVSISLISAIRILNDSDFVAMKNDILTYISDNNISQFNESTKHDIDIFRLYISMINSFGIKFIKTNNIFEYSTEIGNISDYKYILLNRFTSFSKLLDYDIHTFFIRVDGSYLFFGYDNTIISKIKLSNMFIKYIGNINSNCFDSIKRDMMLFDVNTIKILYSLYIYMSKYFDKNSIEFSFEIINDKLIFRYNSVFDIKDVNVDVNNYLTFFKYKSKILYKVSDMEELYTVDFVVKKKTQE